MKIAIVNNMVPYLYGGAEFLADSLCKKLGEYGHQSIVISYPFKWAPKEAILDSIMAVRLNELDNCDLVIALKFPAYYINHPNKKLWLLHQFRQAYDLHGTEYGMFNDNDEHDTAIKNTIIDMDNRFLSQMEGKIFTNSHVVSDRLMKFNGISSEVLYPPLMDASLYSVAEEYGDYIFYPSRVNYSKRQHLAIEAMRYTKSKVKLIIAGKGDSPEDERYLFHLIEMYNLSERVIYLNRFITEQEKIDLFRKSLAGIYIPYDEDSYGYVTLEGFHAGKAMISCKDAGGTNVVVKNEITGYMTDNTPQALAEAMDKLYNDKKKAKEMGLNGLPLLESIGITWDNVIRRLIE
ncbi:glycosyltransferase family 4 protein [Clostridium sp. E02]|uniref:glycosyltransferase family 4 protein n=1 Tax=Clostridium sp. E02 TaxID=2487134 RepID=UPI000F5472D7|nr:glycosyltransferase family 4 protein [Clostridium sp. E02]